MTSGHSKTIACMNLQFQMLAEDMYKVKLVNIFAWGEQSFMSHT